MIGRVAAGTLTLGATEALGVGKKAGSLTAKTFTAGASDLLPNQPIKANDAIKKAVVTPFQSDEDREREARVAREQRRKDYKDLGRSGTILTGPGGLTGSAPGVNKTLIGM